MREQLIADLKSLKVSIPTANTEVYRGAREVITAKDELAIEEGALIKNGSIDGKNAEIRAAQMREFTVMERQNVTEAEDYFEAQKVGLRNLQTELQINLALVELVKGDA
jgi:hypothetical protein